MAVTAIHPRHQRGPAPFLRNAALLAAVVAWAGVFGAAYALGSKSSPRASVQGSTPSLAPGSSVPRSASATVRPSDGSRSLTVSGLHPLAAPPALRPRVLSVAVPRARVYYVPSYRPSAPARPAPAPTPPATTPPTSTGGGPHGSGGTGGGTTTIGSGGGSGGGGLGTTPTTTTPTTSTPTTSTPTTTTPGG